MEFEEYRLKIIESLEVYFNCCIEPHFDGHSDERIIVAFGGMHGFKQSIHLKELYDELRYNLNGNVDEYSLRKEIKTMIRRIEENYLDNTIRMK